VLVGRMDGLRRLSPPGFRLSLQSLRRGRLGQPCTGCGRSSRLPGGNSCRSYLLDPPTEDENAVLARALEQHTTEA
jgi:hypothetical protein